LLSAPSGKGGDVRHGAGSLLVNSVQQGSSAWKAGVRPGDRVLSVNGKKAADEFDFRYLTSQPVSTIRLSRPSRAVSAVLRRPAGEMSGIGFSQPPVARCANRCIFCFIDQMPPGLRKSLYVKDEDITHSFLNGNYVTLSAMSDGQLGRIGRLGLSPLYVSVHATHPCVRRMMLGNPRSRDIMEQLRRLQRLRISFHTQIVVCPGFNNGPVLAKTLADLLTLGQSLLSIAVVPVGLTKHRRFPLAAVDKKEALRICEKVNAAGDADEKKNGGRRIFCADELFIKAGLAIPSKRYYEQYPQIENGVGLVRQLLEEARTVKRRLASERVASHGKRRGTLKKILCLTSASALPYVDGIMAEVCRLKKNVTVNVMPVVNDYFGDSVTVAGLLTAADMIKTVRQAAAVWDRVMVPGVAFNRRGHTLDGWSISRLRARLGMRVDAATTLSDMVPLL
jgi:putative radical SAM enzyme (TIGR03279 family)